MQSFGMYLPNTYVLYNDTVYKVVSVTKNGWHVLENDNGTLDKKVRTNELKIVEKSPKKALVSDKEERRKLNEEEIKNLWENIDKHRSKKQYAILIEKIKSNIDLNFTYNKQTPITKLLDVCNDLVCMYDILKLMLEYGADIMNVPPNQKTPLQIICEKNGTTQSGKPLIYLIKLSLEYGADPNIGTDNLFNRTTPLFNILNNTSINENCKCEIIKILVENGAIISNNLLNHAGSLKISKLLIENGSNIKQVNLLKQYHMYKNSDDKYTIIRLLLKHECDINIKENKDNTGFTLLTYACKKDDLEFIKFLLNNGADPMILDNFNNIPFLYLSFHKEEPVKTLLETGINPNMHYKDPVGQLGNHDGSTPLIMAINVGSIEVVTTLLKYGADPNMKHKNGSDPLKYACYLGNVMIVSLLLKAGAYVNDESYKITKNPKIRAMFTMYILMQSNKKNSKSKIGSLSLDLMKELKKYI
jgi:ankyrin repeat protein